MSKIEYNNLLLRISQRFDETNALGDLLFLCRGKLATRSDEQIHPDAISLLKELEENGSLGPNNLGLVKDIMKALKEWDFLEEIIKFESSRREYTKLIKKVTVALDKLNDLQRLMSTVCRERIPEERGGDVRDVPSLLQVLEDIGCLGVNNLGILSEVFTELENEELLTEVEDFQKRRIEDTTRERRKAQVEAVMSSAKGATQAIIREVRVHCTFRKISGGLLVVGAGLILSRCSSLEDFVKAFTVAALPAASALRAISEGSVCFTVQAETSSSLQGLWQRYCNGLLQRDLQNFLVTDEIRDLASGEDVMVSVYIDEKEFKEAVAYLTNVEQEEIEIDKVKDGVIQSELPNTIEVKCPDKGPDTHKGEQPRYLDEEKTAFVQKYLEGADDARSVKTETSDSGKETRSALSELEMEERSEFPHDPCLKDVSEEIVGELTRRLDRDQVSRDMFYKSFGLDQHKKLYLPGMRTQVIGELFPDTPINLLKDVCKALQLYDLVDLLEKAKPRTLRPALPLTEMAKLPNNSNRPTTIYSKAKVLIIDNDDNIARSTEIITDLFEKVCPGSKICSVATNYLVTLERYHLETERYSIEEAIDENDQRLLRLHKMLETQKPSNVGPDIDDIEVPFTRPTSRRFRFGDPISEVRSLKREQEVLLEKKNIIEVMITQEEEQSLPVKEKFKAKLSLVCEKWSQEGDNQSVLLFLFQMNTDEMMMQRSRALDPITDIAIKTLESFPTEAKFLLTPEKGRKPRDGETLRNISESLHVQYSGSDRSQDHIVATIFEILSKRWQSLDLISIMREVQRSQNRLIKITDNLSSIPRFQEAEQQS
ncbi:uncharacterized protein [Montipora foliosa]|uniref:uncharacterized protein n=1 Tax=Montipora foliosa TaxID=591990 RepID=UPI0035F117EC